MHAGCASGESCFACWACIWQVGHGCEWLESGAFYPQTPNTSNTPMSAMTVAGLDPWTMLDPYTDTIDENKPFRFGKEHCTYCTPHTLHTLHTRHTRHTAHRTHCTHFTPYTLHTLHTAHTAHRTHCTPYTLHTAHTAHTAHRTHCTPYTLHTLDWLFLQLRILESRKAR